MVLRVFVIPLGIVQIMLIKKLYIWMVLKFIEIKY